MFRWFAISLIAVGASFNAAIAQTGQIGLDWDAAEIGFFETESDSGEVKHGISIHVPSDRLAGQEELLVVTSGFCENNLENLLNYSSQIEGAPQVSLLRMSLEFYGPTVGENQSYMASSGTVDLVDGECSFE